MTDDLDATLDDLLATRDRNNMQPTIAALRAVYEQHPEVPRVLYEVGGAYDTAGEEETALGFYERALAAGLIGDIRRRCFLQYGSTLRNVARFEESLEVFASAREQFPKSAALAVFEAITLHAAGRPNAALGAALTIIADHVSTGDLDRYKPAIRGNAEYVTGLDAR